MIGFHGLFNQQGYFMDPFKSLILFNFDYILRVHYLITDAIDKQMNFYQKKIYSKRLNAG